MIRNTFQTSGNSPGPVGGVRCRVGLLGFGTVGAALARRLTAPDAPASLQLAHICDRRARDKRARQPESLATLTWTDRFDDLLTSDVDVIVEAVSGSEPALDYVRAALLAGKSVVTANRQVLAHHGSALLTLAERQGRQLRFEAAIGGSMPIVRMLGEALGGETIRSVEAILSGSSNAVLATMDAEGCEMDDAIADACARGYADADPSADLDGTDAAARLAVVCALAFGLRVPPGLIETRSARHLRPEDFRAARTRHGTIRQVASAAYDRERSTLSAWVAPLFLPSTSPLARSSGPENVAIIRGMHAGDVVIAGAGAGGEALAVALIADLVTIARDRAAIVPAPRLADPTAVVGLTAHQLAEAV